MKSKDLKRKLDKKCWKLERKLKREVKEQFFIPTDEEFGEMMDIMAFFERRPK